MSTMSNQLIVDFSEHRSVSNQIKKRVQFSSVSSMTIVERIDDKVTSSIWYSSKDYKEMRMDTKRAIVFANKRLSRDNNVDNCMLTGIETLLKPSSIRQTKTCRAQCISSVLEEESKQARAGVYDPERIAWASQCHSMSASKRARVIGMFNAR